MPNKPSSLLKPIFLLTLCWALVPSCVRAATVLNFDGIDDYVQTAVSEEQLAASFTLEAWVKPNAVAGDVAIFSTLDTRNDWDLSGFELHITNGKLVLTIAGYKDKEPTDMDFASTFDILSTHSIPANAWTHVAFSFRPGSATLGTATLFINGAEENSCLCAIVANTLSVASIDANTVLLGQRYSGGLFFGGSLSDVQVWQSARSSTDLYNDMAGYQQEQEGLIALYNMNQGVASADNSLIKTDKNLVTGQDDGLLFNFALSGSTSNWIIREETGDIARPYLIDTYEELQKIGTAEFPLGSVYRLVADLTVPVNTVHTPIGTSDQPFTGTFLGGGHTISGLVVNKTTRLAGLFGSMGGRIDSLGLDNVTISGTSAVGGLTGENSGSINACYVTGTVTASADSVGGLVGINTGSISHSYAKSSVNGGDGVGGLVGVNNNTISGCYAMGAVQGMATVGGLAGFNQGTGSIGNCFATGAVTGNASKDRHGGLVGMNAGSITRSYATGSVTGGTFSGGLVGYGFLSGSVGYSYATGAVMGASTVGGLIGIVDGANGAVDNSYAANSTRAATSPYLVYNGGLIGKAMELDNSKVATDYWDKERSGQEYGIGWSDNKVLTALNSTEMKQAAKLSQLGGFDASGAWQILEGKSYPGLRGVDNAPFAFHDTLHAFKGQFELKRLLLNDYDVETVQANLILHVDSLSQGTTDSTTSLTLASSNVGDQTRLVYRVGEVRASLGDTLWGNQAVALVNNVIIEMKKIATGKIYGDAPFNVAGMYSDGDNTTTDVLTFSSSDTTVVTVTGTLVTIQGAGTAAIVATTAKGASIEQTLAILPKTATVVAQAQTKKYGAVDPILTYTATGLVPGDTVALTRKSGENVDKYAIVPGINRNYDITYTGANLTIDKAPLKITVKNATMVQGDAEPSYEYIFAGFVKQEDASVLSDLHATHAEITKAGTYTLVPGATSLNYALTFVNGTLTVSQPTGIAASALVDNVFLQSVPGGLQVQGLYGRLEVRGLNGQCVMVLNIAGDGYYALDINPGLYVLRQGGRSWTRALR